MFTKRLQLQSHDTVDRCCSESLEVNVIFTDPKGTLAALRTAGKLAQDLGAQIRLVALQAVPCRLPLDQPQVSVDFRKRMLSELVCQAEQDSVGITAHLYLCRDQARTLLQLLKPNSLVVIGAEKRWWPTSEGRLAKALLADGHQVVLTAPK